MPFQIQKKATPKKNADPDLVPVAGKIQLAGYIAGPKATSENPQPTDSQYARGSGRIWDSAEGGIWPDLSKRFGWAWETSAGFGEIWMSVGFGRIWPNPSNSRRSRVVFGLNSQTHASRAWVFGWIRSKSKWPDQWEGWEGDRRRWRRPDWIQPEKGIFIYLFWIILSLNWRGHSYEGPR